MSAELKRNLWLELTPIRMAAGAALALGAFLLVGGFDLEPDTLATAARWTAFLALTFWGARRAADSVAAEAAAGTWDQQRMAPQSATGLIFGKLFGATAFAWYVAAFSLAGLFAARGGAATAEASRIVVAGLFAQSVALAATLVVHRALGGRLRGEVTIAQLAAFGAATGLYWALIALDPQGVANAALLRARVAIYAALSQLRWWDRVLDPQSALWTVALGAIFWLSVAAIRVMREEQGRRDGPTAWIAFLIVLSLTFAGFADERSPYYGYIAFVVAFPFVGAAYAAAAAEPKGWVRLNALRDVAANRDLRRALALTPLWVWALAFAAGWAAFAASVVAVYPAGGAPPYAPAVATLYALRDAALLTALTLTGRRGALPVALGAVALLYGATGALADIDGWGAALAPRGDAAGDLLSPAIQAIAALALLAGAWGRMAARRRAESQTAQPALAG